jgi:serine/threonine protein kinase
VVKVTDFGMSRIIPEKIQDIEKGVDVPADRSPEKPPKKDPSAPEEGGMESKNGTADGNGSTEEDIEEASEKKRRVNFNEEANVSWERESILNPDDSTERHSNLLVWHPLSLPLLSPCPAHTLSPSTHPPTLLLLDSQMTSNLGTTAWCAPELLTSTAKARYTVKVDVYSYGMVLWELWERKRPYEELYSRFDIIDAVRAGRRPPIGADCPAAYRSLIQRCWHDQPARRPTFAYIVRYLKDELAHIKRNRNSSVSGSAFLPMQRTNSLHKSRSAEVKPKSSTGKGTWNFLAPIVGSGGSSSKIHDDSPNTHPVPYVPPPVRLRSQPIVMPQKPSRERLDLLAASPCDVGDSMEPQPSPVENTLPPYLFPEAHQVSVDSSANEETNVSTRNEST